VIRKLEWRNTHAGELALLPFKEGKWLQYYVTSTALTAFT